jgi:hypothetical protein
MINKDFSWMGLEDQVKAELDFALKAWSLSNQQYPAPTLHSVVMTMCAHAYGENGREYSHHGHQEPLASLDSLVDDWISGAFRNMASLHNPISKLSWVAHKRHLVVTTDGRLALVTNRTLPKDNFYLLKGCLAPVVLRTRQVGTYSVVETCFLEEAMFHDEPVNWKEERGRELVLV